MAFYSSWRRETARLPTRPHSRARSLTGDRETRSRWVAGYCELFAFATTKPTADGRTSKAHASLARGQCASDRL
jgi:hypothetical protein